LRSPKPVAISPSPLSGRLIAPFGLGTDTSAPHLPSEPSYRSS
jgi:hypothetical protein